MADLLAVDIEVLGKTVQLLRSSENVLNDAMNAMQKGGHGDIGPQVLVDAADSFQRRWQYGIQQIVDHTKTAADGCEKAHIAYEQADTDVATALQQATSAIGQAAVNAPRTESEHA